MKETTYYPDGKLKSFSMPSNNSKGYIRVEVPHGNLPEYYTSWNGIYYKYLAETDRWKLSEDELGILGYTYTYNASIYRIDECLTKFQNSRKNNFYE